MKLPVTTVMKDYCHYAHNAYSKKKKIFSTVSYMFLIIVSLFSSNIMYSSPVAYGQTADPVLPVISVTASGNDGNVPSSAFDNNLATRWSDEGVGSFIQADLGSGTLKTVTSLEIAWYRAANATITLLFLLLLLGLPVLLPLYSLGIAHVQTVFRAMTLQIPTLDT